MNMARAVTEYTPRDIEITTKHAQGMPSTKLAIEYGLSHQRISQIIAATLSDSDIKRIVEDQRKVFLVDSASKACDNIVHAIHSDDIDLRPWKYRFSEKVLESIGVFPSHTQSQVILNIYQQNNEIHLDQAASTALDHLGINKVDAIDVENE